MAMTMSGFAPTSVGGPKLPTTSENRRISALFQLRTSAKAPGTVPKNSVAVKVGK